MWTPKYRYRILKGKVKNEVERCIKLFSDQKKCSIEELNIQTDHVHLLIKIPPKISIFDFMGMIKGRTAIRVFSKFKELKEKPYWGNHFWAKGYCVDTIGLDEEMICKYVKYQEKQEKRDNEK